MMIMITICLCITVITLVTISIFIANFFDEITDQLDTLRFIAELINMNLRNLNNHMITIEEIERIKKEYL